MVRNDFHPEMGEADYEAQRQANIKANMELMMELGLYQGSSSLFSPKRVAGTPKSKPKPKPASPPGSAEYKGSSPPVERPRRITRSVSRVLDSPNKHHGRGMKRALSDDAIYPSRKVSRREAEYNRSQFDDDSDYEEPRPSGPLNPSRHYRPDSQLQRQADRLGTRIHNPKTFGPIPGIAIGTIWDKRMDCSTDAVHAPTVAGISGNESDGCWSICLSGGYEDDIDLGESFTYTGSGGRDLKGTVNNPKNLRTAPQSSHQKWEGKNAALKRSVETGKPVRVVRGFKAANRYAPEEGYVYSGLYKVVRCWMEKGQAGWRVCKFEFQRLRNQAALPTFDREEEGGEDAEAALQQVGGADPRASPSANCSSSHLSGTIDLTSASSSPSPSPSTSYAFTSATSPHPILKASSDFDRASYIIVSDDESELVEPCSSSSSCSSSCSSSSAGGSEGEVEEILMSLEVDAPSQEQMEESVVRRSARRARQKMVLRWGRDAWK